MDYLSYEEIMDMMMGELVQRSLQEQREKNPAFDKLCTRHLGLQDGLMSRVSVLDSETRKLLENFIKLSIEIDSQKENHLYLQGIRDGIKLLKSLRIL